MADTKFKVGDRVRIARPEYSNFSTKVSREEELSTIGVITEAIRSGAMVNWSGDPAKPPHSTKHWHYQNRSLKLVTDESDTDDVHEPSHYTVGGIDTIDFIEAKGLNFRQANVIKYVVRSEHKGERVKDLEKAAWYLRRELEAARDSA